MYIWCGCAYYATESGDGGGWGGVGQLQPQQVGQGLASNGHAQNTRLRHAGDVAVVAHKQGEYCAVPVNGEHCNRTLRRTW